MNPRVLELLKNPKNIQSEDIKLLKEEISAFPYIQNIRALHLYGVHLYDKENYQKELSVTAAYTTDKKILYQLINGKIQQKPKPEVLEERKEEIVEPANVENQAEETIAVDEKAETQQNSFEEAACLLQKPQPEIKHVYVNGERNRILFEGEENFLDEEQSETIDLESTLEFGTLVTQRQEKNEEPVENNESEVTSAEQENAQVVADFTPETIIEEEKIVSESASETINNNEELSFHETEAFLPEVNIQSETKETNNHSENKELSEEITDFTPETIIEEEQLASKTIEETVNDDAELSFHETEAFLPEVNIQSETEETKNDFEDKEFSEEVADFTPETIIHEESTTEEKSVRDDSELSFHGLESFLPDVTIKAGQSDKAAKPEISSNINKHEEEMRRLIEEVEKKMKAKKEASPEKKEEEPEVQGHEISFAETQSFDVVSSEVKEVLAAKEEIQPVQEELKPEDRQESRPEENKLAETIQEATPAWKPMSFDAHIPDSLINKQPETPQPTPEIVEESQKTETILPAVESMPELVKDHSLQFEKPTDGLKKDPEAPEIHSEEKGEAPVMNVSFFSSNWSIGEPKKEEKNPEEQETKEIPQKESPKTNVADSNVPGFINTWQSWLKIDRTQETEKAKTVNKIKAIDSFIENNPKISQLKEESSFVVKEKTDDISHLMTETLANLYFEQKLYTKAINAFQILINKYPEKKEYFEGKIQEIRDVRGKN